MAREITGGWESGDIVAEGFDSGGAGTINSTVGNQHKDRDANGGTWCILGTTSTANPLRNRFQQNAGVRQLVEAWDRVLVNNTGSSTPRGFVLAYYQGATELGSVRIDGNLKQVSVYRGTATLLASSATGVTPTNRYYVVDVQFRMLDAGGLWNVYVDNVLVVTFSGDTKPGAETYFDTVGYGTSSEFLHDEFARNSITLQFDTLVGLFVAGETITGGTSGATAIVTLVETGILVLRTWNGTAFADNETITGGTSAATAAVDAPNASFVSGFQPQSGIIGEGFVVALTPTANGTTIQLTPSTGTNFSNVDEIPPNTTDYNSSGTNDQYDTYIASNLPASAFAVNSVMGYWYAARDGVVINNARHVVRSGGVDYFGVNRALATTYAPQFYSWNVDPATLAAWAVANVNAVEDGFQVRT